MNDEQQNSRNQPEQSHLTNEAEISNKNQNTDSSSLFLGDSSLQTPDEFKEDKTKSANKDEQLTSSGVDDLQSNSDGAAGTDRAGTAERKSYGDIELNKGLEAQAKDTES